MRRLRHRALTGLAAAAIAAVMVLPWVNPHYALGLALFSSPLARLPEFILGAVLAQPRTARTLAQPQPSWRHSYSPGSSTKVSNGPRDDLSCPTADVALLLTHDNPWSRRPDHIQITNRWRAVPSRLTVTSYFPAHLATRGVLSVTPV